LKKLQGNLPPEVVSESVAHFFKYMQHAYPNATHPATKPFGWSCSPGTFQANPAPPFYSPNSTRFNRAHCLPHLVTLRVFDSEKKNKPRLRLLPK